jgi:peptidoglycan LD-endopeptidase CwlK
MSDMLTYLLERTEKKLVGVHAAVADKARELVKLANKNGINIAVTQGLRTIKEQNELYAQGRTKAGKIVTNAKGGQSIHNYGLAFDFCVFDDNKQPVWSGNGYNKVGALGKQLGLEWGGDWRSFKDLPHFEYTFGLTLKQLQAGKRPPSSGNIVSNIVATTPKSYFEKGDAGTEIKGLQGKLKALGYDIGKTGIDGHFGSATEKAVKAFQKKYGLVVDGVAGVATMAKLTEEYNKLNAPKPETPASKPVETDNKKYRLMTGAFKDAEALTAGVQRLEKEYKWLTYEKADSTDLNPTYRIVTGTFVGLATAEKYAAELNKKYGWLIYVQEA